jgi:hypothetical protein
MAVIAEKTIGGVLFQDGDGAPIHSAPKGTIYVEASDGIGGTQPRCWINYDGTNWNQISYSMYGSMYISGNTTPTTVSTSWTSISNLSLTEDKTNGTINIDISPNDYRLVMDPLFPSMMVEISLYATITKSAASSEITEYDVGVSINNAVPEDGLWSTTTVSDAADDKDYGLITLTWTDDVPANSTFELSARRRTGTDNDIIIRDAYLVINKIR